MKKNWIIIIVAIVALIMGFLAARAYTVQPWQLQPHPKAKIYMKQYPRPQDFEIPHKVPGPMPPRPGPDPSPEHGDPDPWHQ